MIEKSLILIKPDAVQRSLIGEILARIERTTLKLVAMKMVYASKELAGEHYADDDEWLKSVGTKAMSAYKEKGEKVDKTELEIGQMIRRQLMDFISMSPVVAIVAEGHNAVATIRKLVGDTAPAHAPVGTIRGDYAIESYHMADSLGRPLQNLIHASGAPEEAEREIKIWFKDDEIHAYNRVDEGLIYRKVE